MSSLGAIRQIDTSGPEVLKRDLGRLVQILDERFRRIESSVGDTAVTVTVDLRDYAAGDGRTVDTAAIQEAMDDNPGAVIDGAGLTYVSTGTLTVANGVTLQNMTLDCSDLPDEGTAIEVTGTLGSAIELAANLAYATRSVTLSNTSDYAAGDWLLIYSDTLWGTTSAGVIGEIARIKTVDSTTQLTLETPAHNTYTTAANAAVQRLEEEVGAVRFKGVTMYGSGPGLRQKGIVCTHAVDVLVDDCDISLFDTALVEFYGCVDARVRNSELRESRRTGFAYGVLVQRGCRDVLVEGCHFSWMRHAVTIGGSAWVNRYIRVLGNHIDYGVDGLDAHTNAQFFEFSNNTISCSNAADISAATDGIIVQGADFIISNNIVRYPAQTGIWWQNFVEGHPTQPTGIITGNLIVSPGTQGIYVQNVGQDIKGLTIANNVVQNVRGTGTGGIYVFADDFDIRRVTVTGNVLTECQNHGIQLRASTGALEDATVSANQVEVTNDTDAVDGIRVLTCSRVTISGNTVEVANTARHGILTSEASELVIVGNSLKLPASATGHCINIGGTGESMVIQGNRGVNGATGLTLASTITQSIIGDNEFRDCTQHYDISSGSGNRVICGNRVSADVGDAAVTLTAGVSETTQYWATPLTANRAVTLSATGAWNGASFRIVRTTSATGASTLDVGTGPLKSLAVGEWCDVERRASAWMLTGFGTL